MELILTAPFLENVVGVGGAGSARYVKWHGMSMDMTRFLTAMPIHIEQITGLFDLTNILDGNS